MKLPTFKTPAIIAMSMALGIAAGAGVTAIAATAQPNMKSALDSLVAAEGYLTRANNNKGGHRAAALKYVGMAIKETREGIKFAN